MTKWNYEKNDQMDIREMKSQITEMEILLENFICVFEIAWTGIGELQDRE